jgi:hypothetical protein
MLASSLKPIEVLLVEGNTGDVRLTQEALKKGRLAVNLTVAMDGVEATELLYRRDGHAQSKRPISWASRSWR